MYICYVYIEYVHVWELFNRASKLFNLLILFRNIKKIHNIYSVKNKNKNKKKKKGKKKVRQRIELGLFTQKFYVLPLSHVSKREK